ncbi:MULTISPECIES: class II fumarate hydratase [Vagococcus]|uniref:Fumarate hydratase class II n=1 Tax=Vagococcus fluvialis bH819 TaxID=1255619 RepID=A0A1X6WNX6_9ENTE|nr:MULTISPECIES: class II fumarate hydratase [Vagococcus]SLM85932.1 Fumarate hydratase class II [Vagococcus fluvialis bH819]HCM88299.1 class II fumarate hydratase [Vagococcus sp.]
MSFRIEKDSLGEVKVSMNHKWGAQTQRSLENFKIGTDIIPISVVYGLIEIKRAAAIVNHNLGKLSQEKSEMIVLVCDEILAGKWDEEFPLKVYQTGSGTQSNMNANEVIAHLCQEKGIPIHPNDDVNMSQSSNDTFPTAMHIGASLELQPLFKELDNWIKLLAELEDINKNIIKIGRTHLQDATPLTFGQEISGWKTMIEKSKQFIKISSESLHFLAIGGTAVGTGLNAPKDFDVKMAKEITSHTKFPFETEKNKFYGLTSHSGMSFTHGALRALASDLMKIANDIRWLASGPRAGLGEINIPENEPGSSIMPGKVNPTQAESLTMIACQIMGNDTTIQVASSQGNFELNVFKPVIINNFLESVTLLVDGMTSFRLHCLSGLEAKKEAMAEGVNRSLMLVTALSPYIGYEKCAEVAKYAHKNKLSLKEAVLQLEYATEKEFNNWVRPESMI